MSRYLFIIFLFSIQSLLANWDQYAGERLILFSLAPGIGEQFSESYQEQLIPAYFRKIASQYPEIKAKIIAIDPRLSQDPTAKQYAFLFLEGWENEGMIFKKENIEIQFFSEYIPLIPNHLSTDDYANRIESYLLQVFANKGCAFIGHHGHSFYAFEPFRIVYNKLKCDSIQMYIYCENWSLSYPIVYENRLCHKEELKKLHQIVLDYFSDWSVLEELNSKEACYSIFHKLIQKLDNPLIYYPEMKDLPYKMYSTSNGNFFLLLDSH